jgi:hypothetical protein
MLSNENVNEHNVTLFSNEDTDRFNNTLSEFTNTLTPPLVLKPLGKWRVGMSDVTHSHNLKRAFRRGDDVIQFPQFLAGREVKFYAVPHFAELFAKASFIYTDSYFHPFLNFEKMLNFPVGFQDFNPPKQKEGEPKAQVFLLNLEMDEEDLRKISRSADVEQGGNGGRSRRSIPIQNTNQGGGKPSTNVVQGGGAGKTKEEIDEIKKRAALEKDKEKLAAQIRNANGKPGVIAGQGAGGDKAKNEVEKEKDNKKNSVRDQNTDQKDGKPKPVKNEEKDSIYATFKVGVLYTGKQVLYTILVAAKTLMDTHKKTVVEFSYKELRAKALINIASNFIDYLQQEARGRKRFKSEDVHGNYMFVYTDIIRPRHVGSQFHSVMSVLPIKEISQEYTAIKHIQYFPVNKEVINDPHI